MFNQDLAIGKIRDLCCDAGFMVIDASVPHGAKWEPDCEPLGVVEIIQKHSPFLVQTAREWQHGRDTKFWDLSLDTFGTEVIFLIIQERIGPKAEPDAKLLAQAVNRLRITQKNGMTYFAAHEFEIIPNPVRFRPRDYFCVRKTIHSWEGIGRDGKAPGVDMSKLRVTLDNPALNKLRTEFAQTERT